VLRPGRGDLPSNLAILAAAVAYATLGALVICRAGNLIGWLMLAEGTALVVMTLAATYGLLGIATVPGDLPAAQRVGTLAECSFASVTFVIAFTLLLFPTGRLPSRRWRPVAAAGIVLAGLTTIGLVLRPHGAAAPSRRGLGDLRQPVRHDAPAAGAAGRADRRLLRQQIKWLTLAAGAFVASLSLASLSLWAGQPGLNSAANFVSEVVPLFGIPAAIAAAILKHQLYDIDRIIGRTLSYAIVTGLLVGVYAGLVLLATQVLSFSSPVAVAASALAAAALFSPLRRRVQQAADRRFKRARYDADHTVTAFAARLQGEVDIGAVRADLLDTVNRTLEPVQLSVWLSSVPERKGLGGGDTDGSGPDEGQGVHHDTGVELLAQEEPDVAGLVHHGAEDLGQHDRV